MPVAATGVRAIGTVSAVPRPLGCSSTFPAGASLIAGSAARRCVRARWLNGFLARVYRTVGIGRRRVPRVPLDFYAIDDEDPMPDDPAELAYLGDIDLREHEALAKTWAACEARAQLPYFSDSRLTATQLRRLRDCLEAHVETGAGPNTVIVRLVAAFGIAIEEGRGLVAFAD